ncbi:hypothetical protein E5288_WYG007878 [Bos mutus]|uniref:Nicotinamide riboside kinase 1 n=1 Tax=Bos mutus TaxID=72004 RepID=A0A6B0S8B9_9CETA|nr:hypothetical protein [Bos mutus]
MGRSHHIDGKVAANDNAEKPRFCVSVNMKFPTYFDSTRVYKPPDAPGYFDGHVWPMYLKHRKEMENVSWEIVYLDGTKSEEDLFSQVYEDLIQELAKQKG